MQPTATSVPASTGSTMTSSDVRLLPLLGLLAVPLVVVVIVVAMLAVQHHRRNKSTRCSGRSKPVDEYRDTTSPAYVPHRTSNDLAVVGDSDIYWQSPAAAAADRNCVATRPALQQRQPRDGGGGGTRGFTDRGDGMQEDLSADVYARIGIESTQNDC